MFTQFEAPPGVLQEKHIVYQNSRGQFFTTVNCHQKPEQHFYRSFEITYSRAVPLENPVRDCFTQEQSPGISMAPGAQRTSNTSNNIHVYRVPRSIYGTHYVPRRVTTITTNDNDWKNDILTQSLTKQVAYILYHREPTSDHRKVALRFTHLHEHEQISKLLGQYEPGGQVDREALKAILEHIEPLVKTEKINLQLYSFVKDFVMLRQEWLKAAGDQYGLLAYLDVCQEWGLAGAGPSYANQLVDLNVELQGLQARHEYSRMNLYCFKLSPLFYQHMTTLFTYFEQVKAEEEARRQRLLEVERQAKEAQKKRAALKILNERITTRQLGSGAEAEMGDQQQQRLLDWMSKSMAHELDVEVREDDH